MKFFIAAVFVIFAMLFFDCKEKGALPPEQTSAAAQEAAEDADDSELLEQIGDAQADEETQGNSEPKRLSAPIPPISAVSAPLATLAAKSRPKTANSVPVKTPEPEPPKPEAPPEDVAPKIAHAPDTWAGAGDSGQLNSGRYTIQVGVFPNEIAAKKHIAQLAQNGINAYHTRVSNPAKLLGSHYRVRIGYFSERAYAETYAKSKLEPIGYAWWVDLAKNDKVASE
ncbi:MAG: SPOR domain-containing protein [Fibromonadaceae bacterium]|jgi:cell division septation protein DedD|nr:SPOR domain-containing protein [Fibromonadaceae bacterium]